MSSAASLRIGEADSSIERSAPLARETNSARRLKFTGAPLVSACFTGIREQPPVRLIDQPNHVLEIELNTGHLVPTRRDLESCSAAGFM